MHNYIYYFISYKSLKTCGDERSLVNLHFDMLMDFSFFSHPLNKPQYYYFNIFLYHLITNLPLLYIWLKP